MAALAEKIQEHHAEKPADYDQLLYNIYHDQKRIIRQWGVTIPPERELFEKGCPIEAKVMFFDWLIREGLAV